MIRAFTGCQFQITRSPIEQFFPSILYFSRSPIVQLTYIVLGCLRELILRSKESPQEDYQDRRKDPGKNISKGRKKTTRK